MTKMNREIFDMFGELVKTLESAGRKLREAHDSGPEHPDVVLTPAEATVIYRVIAEKCGVRL